MVSVDTYRGKVKLCDEEAAHGDVLIHLISLLGMYRYIITIHTETSYIKYYLSLPNTRRGLSTSICFHCSVVNHERNDCNSDVVLAPG